MERRQGTVDGVRRSDRPSDAIVAGRQNQPASQRPRRDERWPDVVIVDPFTAGLALARRMRRLGARVTMLVATDDLFVDRSRGVRSVVLPFERDGWMAALHGLVSSCERALVLPATDRSCEMLIESAGSLPENVLMFEREACGHVALMSKDESEAIARDAGVRVPWSMRIDDQAALSDALRAARWPCVVKPILSHQWRARYGIDRVFHVADADQARLRLERPLSDGVAMMLSQYIPGEDGDVEEAILVRMHDGSYPVQFGCRKLRQYPRGFGVTTLGEASTLPETMRIAKSVLDAAGFVGVAGVETKRHNETGERWFLEVNVRVPGQWGLGDACGADASRRLVDALSGTSLGPAPSIEPGVRFVLPDLDAHVLKPLLLAAPARRRPVIVWETLRAYAGARSFGVLDPCDPGPGMAWVSLLARRRIQALSAKLGAVARRD